MYKKGLYALNFLVLVFFLGLCVILGECNAPVFTGKEKAAIDKLRDAVGSKLTAPHMKSDAYLIKWLKAKKFDHAKAKEALEKTLQWRKTVDADNLPNYDFGREMNKGYVLDFTTAKDKFGNPIVLMPYGDWDVRRKVIQGKLSSVELRLDFMEETAAQLSFNATKNPTSLLLVDVTGFSLRNHACTGCVPIYLNWAIHHEIHYPYNFYRILCMNTPRIFDPIHKLMKPLMTEATQDAFRIVGYDRQAHAEEISKYANLDDIPIRFAGNKRVKS